MWFTCQGRGRGGKGLGFFCDPILVLKINVAASFNQLIRDSSMPISCREVER